jgi:putative phosphoribosyl transferase
MRSKSRHPKSLKPIRWGYKQMKLAIPEQSVKIPPDGLAGDLVIPEAAQGIILFAHGSGSSRHSPRNRYVASVLNQSGFATLLLDLLTEAEEQVDLRTGELRFDIGLLAERLVEATDWLQREPSTGGLSIGYFGASTGAGAALVSAAECPRVVAAVVSRGGRPDLAGPALPHVKAPTLLIVGGDDQAVERLNREALEKMGCPKRLAIVPGASHLFEEPGALEEVSRLARDWFEEHVRTG